MLGTEIEYGVCLSENGEGGHLVDKIEALRDIDPEKFWSQSVIDEALRLCCVIIEQTGGDLHAIWRAKMYVQWNAWMTRFRELGIDLDLQLRDRQGVILVPYEQTTVRSLVLHDGVTWRVQEVDPGKRMLSRMGRSIIVTFRPGREVEVVLRG